MARKRQRSNKDLPEFLQVNRTGGKIYYSYILPDGRRKSLGQDRAAAIQATLQLNDKFAPIRKQMAADELVRRMDDPLLITNPPFNAVADGYLAEKCGHLSPGSRANRQREIARAKKAWGQMPIQRIYTFHVAQFLKPMTLNARKAHRNALDKLWKYAKSEGFTNENPVADTEAIKQPARKRKRHTWKGYCALLDAAEDWLAYSMKLSLYSLQRRTDVVLLSWEKIDMTRRTIEVRQGKTGAWLKITMGDELFEVIQWFASTGLDCPYVVHRKPARRTNKLMEAVRAGRQHINQVTPGAYSRAVQAVRDASGYYDHLPRTSARHSMICGHWGSSRWQRPGTRLSTSRPSPDTPTRT